MLGGGILDLDQLNQNMALMIKKYILFKINKRIIFYGKFLFKQRRKNILSKLINKRLIKYRHDPFDRFGNETVYGKVELFFDDFVISISYDYDAYPLFGSKDDEHPKFSIKIISEDEAKSALENTEQINITCGEIIERIILVEDHSCVQWDGKNDEAMILKAVIFKFKNNEIAFQGDYMIPLIDIFKGNDLKDKLEMPGAEFDQPETKYTAKRIFVEIK